MQSQQKTDFCIKVWFNQWYFVTKIVLTYCFFRSLEQFIQNNVWENFSRNIPIFNRKKGSDFDIENWLWLFSYFNKKLSKQLVYHLVPMQNSFWNLENFPTVYCTLFIKQFFSIELFSQVWLKEFSTNF